MISHHNLIVLEFNTRFALCKYNFIVKKLNKHEKQRVVINIFFSCPFSLNFITSC